ncbi:MAG TPA: immunoglobulin-like domain-containing protein [Clostridia bacterium]|nr:immunoglobulin-like domain-containing protein [Clostridia bacterium]
MEKIYKKTLHLLLIISILVNSLFLPFTAEASTAPDKEIEVTLAADTASNNLDLTGFSDRLKNRLNTTYGVPLDRIHVNAVDTSVVSSSIDWYRFDHTNYPENVVDTTISIVKHIGTATSPSDRYIGPGLPTNYTQPTHVLTSGSSIDFYGYGSPAFKDFLFAPNNNANNKVFSFLLNEQVVDYHTAEGVGFMFNARYTYSSSSDRRLSGYMVLIGQSSVYLYRLDNIEINQFMNSSNITLGAAPSASKWGGTVYCMNSIPKPAPSSGTMRYLKLAASPASVSFYQFTDSTYSTIKNKILDNVALTTTYNTFGFGPIACYTAHNCQSLTHVTFSNLAMSEDTSVSFTDMVKNTSWNYQDSFRVIANVDNDGVPDFADKSDLATILYYMMQNSTHYVGWGINNALSPVIGSYNSVKAQSDGFVERNNGRGIFINRTDGNCDTLDEGTDALADYIADQLDLMPVISKPIINTDFDGNFLSNGSVTCSTPTTVSSLGNPVGAYKWRVMDVEGGIWQDQGTDSTTSLVFPTGTYNIVSLRIQDSVTGSWSDYAIAYIANDTVAPPVSIFTLDKSELMPDTEIAGLQTTETVQATDASYHPAGEAISGWEWKVYNSILVEQTGLASASQNPIFDFAGKAAGKYTIKLRVEKGPGNWSAYYNQTVTVFRESGSITISRTDPAGSGDVIYTDASKSFSFGVDSTSGSLAGYRVIKIPADGGSNVVGDWTTVSGTSIIGSSTVSGGSYEIYVQAKDVNGNSKTQSLGVFSRGSSPEVRTAGASAIGGVTATVSGYVYSSGGLDVTACGVEYKISSGTEYITANAAGAGTGSFSVTLTGLTPETEYTFRAFAVNSAGTGYGENIQFTTTSRSMSAEPDEVMTEENLDGMTIELTLVGESFKNGLDKSGITLNNGPEGLTVAEAVYQDASSSIITLDFDGTHFDSIINDFSITVAGSALEENTSITSDNMTIINTIAPAITTFTLANDIGSISATVRGMVNSTGGTDTVERGIEYREASETVYSAVYAEAGGLGDFSVKLTGLAPNTEYTARAYAANNVGKCYGGNIQFTTTGRSMSAEPDEALTEENLDGMEISLTLAGDSFKNGLRESDIILNNAPEGLTVAEAVYQDASSSIITLDFDGTHFNNVINNFNITVDGSALKENTSITSDNMTIINTMTPVVTTAADMDISGVTATVRGMVTSTGGTDTVRRGIKYKSVTASEFTTVETTDGGTGDFSVTLTGLTPNTVYIVKAFASNRIGTSYGEARQFTTTSRYLMAAPDTLKKEDLDGLILTLTLAGDSLRSGLNKSAITLNNAPAGLTVTNAVRENAASCKLTLAFNGDFSNSISNFSISVAGTALTGGTGITSNSMTIQASNLWSDVNSLDIVYADYDNMAEVSDDNADHVTRAIYLPVKGRSGKTTITWESGNTNLITASGRVKRPEPEGSDTLVTLTATITEDATGIQATRQFTVKVLKLSDEDAALDAGKNLTMETAFDFGAGDTWECITLNFWALTTGSHNTEISWTSDSDTIILQPGEGKVDATVTRPSAAGSNKNVILTAHITKGSASITKKFLLVVQKEGVVKEEIRGNTGRTAEAGASGQSDTFEIGRTVLEDETKIDYVMVETDKIIALTEAMDPQNSGENQNTVSISMQQDANDKADQLAVEIPAAAISAIADRNAVLEVNTDEGSIKLEQSILNEMAQSGTDLYFRIVPVNDASEQDNAKSNARTDTNIIQLVSGGKELNVLGIPRKIETNYTGYRTTVILPLDGVTIPEEGRAEFLDSLRVFIEHSDSTELLTPVIVYKNGVPSGVQFEIEEFSRFQIVRASAVNRDNDSDDTSKPKVIPAPIPVTKPSTPETGIEIGSAELNDVADIEKTHKDGNAEVKITINNDKLIDIIKNGENGETISIVTSEQANKYEVILNAELLKLMQTKEDTASIVAPEATWNIPAAAVNTAGLNGILGSSDDLKDVMVKLTLDKVTGGKQNQITAAIKAKGAQMSAVPLASSISFSFSGKDIPVGLLDQYIEMIIPMPEGIALQKITTGVYVDDEMKISHVPTEVTVTGGKYYAKINSLYGDGIHTVIWNPKEFPDVVRHWAKIETNDTYSRMIVFGENSGLYKPDKEITRAEFAAILVRGLGLRPVEGNVSFSDVAKTAWYHDVVITAAEFELIKGYGDGTFGPDKLISREEAMAMTARAMNLTGLSLEPNSEETESLLGTLKDAGDTAGWAKASVARCIRTGVITGIGDKHIAPKENITKAQVAAIVRRLLQESGLI